MSTLKVNKIENTATTDGGVEIDNTGHVQIDGVQMPTAGPLSNRNLIINGAMQVAQRGTTFTSAASGSYTLDRWSFGNGSSAVFDITQSSTAPAGFTSSLKVDCTTAATPTGTDECFIRQYVEAQNLQHLQYGTSGAQTLTYSFWVKSNKAGTYGVRFWQEDSSEQYATTYSIPSDEVNIWKRKSITISGNTGATITNDNGRGFEIRFYFLAGPNRAGTPANAWNTDNDNRTTDLNLADSTDNEWLITGVQLEVGEKATPFEHRSYGDELARCQRYYEQVKQTGSQFNSVGQGSVLGTKFYTTLWYRTEKRTTPSVATSSGAKFEVGLPSSQTNVAADEFYDPGVCACRMRIDVGSGHTNGSAGQCAFDGNQVSNASINIDAEL